MNNGTKSAEKRRKILKATVELFSRTHNVKRVSIEDIAKAANVSPTTIYNNFGNRETLVGEVVKELVESSLERYRRTMKADMPFPQKLGTIMGSKLEMADKVNAEVFEKLVSQDKTMASFVDRLMESEIKPIWREMMRDGKKQGYIDPALDDQALVMYLDVLQAGFRARPDYMDKLKDNIKLIRQLSQLMFYGFLKKDLGLFGKEGK